MLFTVNTLKKNADTLEHIPTCGFEEHVHEDDCYGEAGELTCGLVEHIHTDACYQESPVKAEPVDEEDEAAEWEDETAEWDEQYADPEDEADDWDEVYADPEDEADDWEEEYTLPWAAVADWEEEAEDPVAETDDPEAYDALDEDIADVDDDEIAEEADIPDEADGEADEGEAEAALLDEASVTEAVDAEIEEEALDAEQDETAESSESEDAAVSEPEDAAEPEQDESADISEPETAAEPEQGEAAESSESEETAVSETEDAAAPEQDENADISGVETAAEPEQGEAAESSESEDTAVSEPEDAAAPDQDKTADAAEPEDAAASEPASAAAPEAGEAAASPEPVEQAVELTQTVAPEAVELTLSSGDAPAAEAPQAETPATQESVESASLALAVSADAAQAEAAPSIHIAYDFAQAGDAPLSLRVLIDATGETAGDAEVDAVPSESGDAAAEPEEIAETETAGEIPEVAVDVPEEIAETGEYIDEEAPEAAEPVEVYAEPAETAAEAIEPAEAVEVCAEPEDDNNEETLEPEAAAEEIAVSGEAAEALPEDGAPEEADEPEPAEPVEIAPVEAAPAETTAELGEPVLAYGPVEYDAALVAVEALDDDYIVTPVADFETTDVVWGRYVFTLLNGKAPARYPAQSFAGSTEYVSVSVEAAEGAFPAGTTMTVADIDDAATIEGITEKAEEGFVKVERVHAVDITFCDAEGAEIEPLIPISVVMTVREVEEDRETMVVHVDADAQAEIIETTGDDVPAEAAEGDYSVGFVADAFSVYSLVVGQRIETKVIAADGNTYYIEVTYSEDAHIPAGATLSVAEVTEDGQYLAQAREQLAGNKLITLARFFDIKIMDGDTEVQPDAPVEVRIWLDGKPAETEKAEAADAPEAGQADETVSDEAAEDASDEPVEIAAEEVDETYAEAELSLEADAEDAEPDGLTAEYEAIPEEAFETSEETSDVSKEASDAPEDHIVTVGEPVARAAHFADEGDLRMLEAAEAEQAVVFTADGFSVWGVVYTVDFYFGNYEYHMEGESSVLLSELFDLLKIEKDVADVERVTFTDDELLKIEKLDDEAHKDWKLTSLAPFGSDEKLTVELGSGEIIVIKVLDAVYPPYFTVNVSSAGGGQVSTDGYTYADSLITTMRVGRMNWDGWNSTPLYAKAKPGYVFVRWEKDGKDTGITSPTIGDKDNPIDGQDGIWISFSYNGYPHTLTAVFKKVQFKIHKFDSDYTHGTISSKYYGFEDDGRTGKAGTQDRVFEVGDADCMRYGFTTGNTNGYHLAFWMLNNGTILSESPKNTTVPPYDGAIYTAYFRPANTKLVAYLVQGEGTTALESNHESIVEANYKSDDPAKYAVPVADDGWAFYAWTNTDGTVVTLANKYPVADIDGDTVAVAKLIQKSTANITVNTNNVSMGKVTYQPYRTNPNYTPEYTGGNTDSNGQLYFTLTAEPASNEYEFVRWERNGMPLDGIGSEFAAGEATNVYFQDGDTLTAVFREKPDAPKPNDEKYPGRDFNIDELEKWKDGLNYDNYITNRQKTAEVYDYDNRIYQVDLIGNSGIWAAADDIKLAFVTDVSNSMLFPSKLSNSVGTYTMTQSGLSKLDKSKVYITISNVSGTATQYALYYDDGSHNKFDQWGNRYSSPLESWLYPWAQQDDVNQKDSKGNTIKKLSQKIEASDVGTGWRYIDASYYAKYRAMIAKGERCYITSGLGDSNIYTQRPGKLVSSTKAEIFGGGDTGEYVIYEPAGDWLNGFGDIYNKGHNRLEDLKESLGSAIDDVQEVVSKNAYDEDTTVYVALETFAKYVYVKDNFKAVTGSQGEANQTAIQNRLSGITSADGTRQDKALYALWTSIYNNGSLRTYPNTVTHSKESNTLYVGGATDVIDNTVGKGNTDLDWNIGGTPGKKYAILITDGAPLINSTDNPDDDLQDRILKQRDELAKQGITLITIGLSMGNVEKGAETLSLAGGGKDGYFYKVEDTTQLQYVLRDIIKSIMVEALVYGDVTDEIDEAFYPVHPNGTPMEPGNYTVNDDGTFTKINGMPASDARYMKLEPNGKGKYKVTWVNQEFPKESDAPWHGTIYVKAKEDFLGGNTIKTNDGVSMVAKGYTATSYKKDENGNDVVDATRKIELSTDQQKEQTFTDKPASESKKYKHDDNLTTPYVNVDELSLTEESSEWSVYLGETVDPLAELKQFYEDINVKEVVKRTTNGEHVTMTGKDDTLYTVTQGDGREALHAATQDGRDPKSGAVPETIPLSEVIAKHTSQIEDGPKSGDLTEDEWKTLLNGDPVTRYYEEYGHTPGKIVITLVNEIKDGEKVIKGDDYVSETENHGHQTTVTTGLNDMTPVEKYTLKVEYVPDDVDDSTDYRTGHFRTGSEGKPTDHFTSDNEHIIHVYVDDLKLTKVDMASGNPITSQAVFTLYREAAASDAEADKVTLSGIGGLDTSKKYVVVTTFDTTNGTSDKYPVPLLKNKANYYLVETQPPEGYEPWKEALTVNVSIDNKYGELSDESNALTEKPEGAYNWSQKTMLVITGSEAMNAYHGKKDGFTYSFDDMPNTLECVAKDTAGVKLPSTGGAGTTLFHAAGALLALAAAILLIVRRRVGQDE